MSMARKRSDTWVKSTESHKREKKKKGSKIHSYNQE